MSAEDRAQRFFDPLLLLAALLVVPVIVLEQADVSNAWKSAAEIANWGIWSVFVLEVAVMLTVSTDRRRWLRGHLLDLVIVTLTPPFLPQSLQAARLLRLVRIARIAAIPVLMRRRLNEADAIKYVTVLVIVTALGGGAAFAAVEEGRSTWDGVWWALVTMTTVGYGDIGPATSAGRLVGLVVMLVGVGFVAILTAAIAERFVAARVRAAEHELAEDIDLAEDDLLAQLRDIRERLGTLETALARRGR